MAESLLKPSWLLLARGRATGYRLSGAAAMSLRPSDRLQQDVLVRTGTLANLAEIKPNHSGFSIIWMCMRSRVWKPCERPPAQQRKLLLTLVLNNSGLVFFSEVISQFVF